MRPYTGNTDPATRARPGTKKMQDLMVYLFGMENLGIYASRQVRNGSPTAPLSVHATGRAADLGGTREQVKRAIDFLYTHRNALEIEAIHDYVGAWIPTRGFGAAYRCSRDRGGLLSGWTVYQRNTIGRGGLWTHYEISPAMAADPKRVEAAFTRILS